MAFLLECKNTQKFAAMIQPDPNFRKNPNAPHCKKYLFDCFLYKHHPASLVLRLLQVALNGIYRKVNGNTVLGDSFHFINLTFLGEEEKPESCAQEYNSDIHSNIIFAKNP